MVCASCGKTVRNPETAQKMVKTNGQVAFVHPDHGDKANPCRNDMQRRGYRKFQVHPEPETAKV